MVLCLLFLGWDFDYFLSNVGILFIKQSIKESGGFDESKPYR